MSSNIVTVIILRLAIALAAPMQMTLLQQLQGLSQQLTLNQMTHQQTPLQQMMQQQTPLHQMTQQQTSLQQMTQQQMPLQQMSQEHMPIHQMMQTQFPLQEIQQPMTMPLLQPLQPTQGTAQQQRLALQEQKFALQQFQALQRIGLVPSPMSMNTQPILVLYPDYESDIHTADLKANRYKHQTTKQGDEDSEIIDAAASEEIEETVPKMKAVLLMPNTRGIIGSIIEQIPFLPFEINVPDTIAWIYNGIASIIAGLGQRLPFRPQTPAAETPIEGNVKSIWKNNRQKLPIVVMPLGR